MMSRIAPLFFCSALALTPFLALQELQPEAPTPEEVQRQAEQARREVEEVLDGFHQAARRADAKRFFRVLADDAIYFGTDASERWTRRQLEQMLEPAFEAGSGWNTRASEVHVFLSDSGDFAWFDERLKSERWGPMRGTGVLRKEDGRWKIVQYNTAFTIPNDFVPDMVEQLRELSRKR